MYHDYDVISNSSITGTGIQRRKYYKCEWVALLAKHWLEGREHTLRALSPEEETYLIKIKLQIVIGILKKKIE